jgi:hypothetical protein
MLRLRRVERRWFVLQWELVPWLRDVSVVLEWKGGCEAGGSYVVGNPRQTNRMSGG